MSTATQVESFVSVGRLADRFDVPRDSVRIAAAAAGIVPAQRLDGVDYFREQDSSSIAEHLSKEGK